MFRIFFLMLFAASLQAGEIHLGLLGNIPEAKTVELLAAKIAVDAANAIPNNNLGSIKLVAVNDKGTLEGALEAAKKLADDPEMLGVVIHGELGVSPEVLKIFSDAGLAVVSASSWMMPRAVSATATWLSPQQEELAQVAAIYARKARQTRQVAVIDNGAPTAAAAAVAFSTRFKEMGGKINYEGEWQGSDWGLTRTVKALSANWPQVIFFVGEGRDAGILVKAMRKEKALKSSVLLGLPTLFDPAFIDMARIDTKQSTAVFPCPDFRSSALIEKQLGTSFARTTPQYRAYLSYADKKPGRWTSMIFDGMQLLVDAVTKAAAEPLALSPTAASVSDTSQAAVISRLAVEEALKSIPGYKGIRGKVKFGANREPLDPKAMIFNAQTKVNTREMRWLEYNYGPPF